jgi:hypothetical protein
MNDDIEPGRMNWAGIITLAVGVAIAVGLYLTAYHKAEVPKPPEPPDWRIEAMAPPEAAEAEDTGTKSIPHMLRERVLDMARDKLSKD